MKHCSLKNCTNTAYQEVWDKTLQRTVPACIEHVNQIFSCGTGYDLTNVSERISLSTKIDNIGFVGDDYGKV